MLALPSHALASAAMLACGLVNEAVPSHAASASPETADACHGHGESDAPQPAAECEHCAACAVASALPVQPGKDLPQASLAAYGAAQPAARFGGFIPDGPERPPRSFLA